LGGQRKIVVATNIAETSITIDDVTHVIDVGRAKETEYDAINSMSCLADTWISKANARQRRGRAGRTQPGKCYKLYTRVRYDKLADQQLPEVLRTPLDQLCLQIMTTQTTSVGDFLDSLLDSPSTATVDAALLSLRQIQAIDAHNKLTGLGAHIAQIPADVRVSKLLLFGAILRCLDPVLTVAACMTSNQSPFLNPFERRDEAKAHLKFVVGKSDLLAFERAFSLWAEAKTCGDSAERRFCDENFISSRSMYEISETRKQLFGCLVEMGFVPSDNRRRGKGRLGGEFLNYYSGNVKIIKAALCAGLYPNVARVRLPPKVYTQTENGTVAADFKSKEIIMFLRNGGRVFLHPASMLSNEGRYEDLQVIFHQKVATTKVFLRDATTVSAYPIMLFGGQLAVSHEGNSLTVDDWLDFRAPARIAVACEKLRISLDNILKEKIDRPSIDVSDCGIVKAISHLLITDGMA
jgi:ATP-dependent RNA helicase DHX57